MRIAIQDDTIQFGPTVALHRFSQLAHVFLSHEPSTPQIEAQSVALANGGFPDDGIVAFVRNVCKWGGYSGISGRTLNRNTIPEIRKALESAVRFLDHNPPRIKEALSAINMLNSLGSTSFASKHLRFLCPKHCGVLDAILTQELTYTIDPAGYEEFCHDCVLIAQRLQTGGAQNPMNRHAGAWFAADVEMALFAHFSEWTPIGANQ